MTLWQLLGVVFVAGGIGGMVNSLISDKGFVLPHTVPRGDGTSILLPGFIGNMLMGGISAGVSWLLYGPLSQAQLNVATVNITTTLTALGGAILVGMAGSGWLKNAVDKNVLRAAASQAAASPSAPDVAQQMLQAQPTEVLKLAQKIGEQVSVPASTVNR